MSRNTEATLYVADLCPQSCAALMQLGLHPEPAPVLTGLIRRLSDTPRAEFSLH